MYIVHVQYVRLDCVHVLVHVLCIYMYMQGICVLCIYMYNNYYACVHIHSSKGQ